VRTSVRAWFAAGLLALLAAAALHALALLGMGAAWAVMIHLTVFGWITALIVAVRYHTLPVFAGSAFPAAWPAWVQLALTAAGLACVAAGAWAAGLALQLAAALVFAANTALLFARRRRGAPAGLRPPIPGLERTDRVGLAAASAATASLPLALGLLLAARVGALRGEWWLAAEHLAALGWVMLMIVGVAYHVLPRFSGRGLRGLAWARAQLACHLAALALIVLGLGLGQPQAFAAGGALIALAMALFALTIWPTIHFGFWIHPFGVPDFGLLRGSPKSKIQNRQSKIR
jgi:hypothetical protein